LFALHLIAYSVYNFGFDILSFISHFIDIAPYQPSKSYRYKLQNNQTTQLRDSHIVLE